MNALLILINSNFIYCNNLDFINNIKEKFDNEKPIKIQLIDEGNEKLLKNLEIKLGGRGLNAKKN